MPADKDQIRLLQDAIEASSEIADKAPEKYQQQSFHVAMQYFLAQHPQIDVKPSKTSPKRSHPQQPEKNNLLENSSFDWTKTNISDIQNSLDQYLVIIELARTKIKVEGLSPREIREILFKNFRISRSPNSISMSLMKAYNKKYVERNTRENEYVYYILNDGINRIKEQNLV